MPIFIDYTFENILCYWSGILHKVEANSVTLGENYSGFAQDATHKPTKYHLGGRLMS